ncbi:MAG TPA: hypothetical protein VFY01_00005, partial [Rheinheimera sp.]|nr:hypothetical protein [Rheinheimera sp.]
MTWHNSKRIARRSLKWLNWTLLLPSLLLMLLLAALLFTAPGLHLTLWLAETAVPGLHIARSDGSVLGGHRLYQIRYQQPGINLNVQQSELIFNNGCLFNLSACVEKLALQGLTLQLTP